MFAGYVGAGGLSVPAALQKTLDPAKRCRLCVSVARAREKSREQLPRAVERSAEKLLLALHSPAPFVFARDPAAWTEPRTAAAPSRREPVPVPPPRV